MNTLSISTGTNRLSRVFKDWQLAALSTLPDGVEDPIGTREIWEKTNSSLSEEFSEPRTISRASVINFIKKLGRMGLLEGISGTGKGGTRENYRYISDRHFFNVQLASMLLGAIIEEYPDVDVPWVLTASPDEMILAPMPTI